LPKISINEIVKKWIWGRLPLRGGMVVKLQKETFQIPVQETFPENCVEITIY